ncbi:D-Ala-D-Ala carboxypeptidase family metallohydrolase [Thermoflavimicrobium daqui]|jgi:peptidoglycan hydrolase-like protein with peptidoglycan-binding domain|nr:D-Ala-D-Ala carboxypeptidase family metallohydrolase [Thermoflavimicrobium daqui]
MLTAFALILTMIYIPSTADAYNWSRTLKKGDKGNDVKELQIRVAGWAADSPSKTYVSVDGQFGAGTEAAVKRFQKAYGLKPTGIVGPETHAKLNALEDADGSTKHFNWNEFYSKDGSKFTGGKVNEQAVKENVRRTMWKLEAMRKKAGERAVTVNSGFRSIKHNKKVGGASNSQHQYGIAADIKIKGYSVSKMFELGKTCGFSGLLTYEAKGFLHVDSRIEYPYGAQSWLWK